jgi:hypothetical protein
MTEVAVRLRPMSRLNGRKKTEAPVVKMPELNAFRSAPAAAIHHPKYTDLVRAYILRTRSLNITHGIIAPQIL